MKTYRALDQLIHGVVRNRKKTTTSFLIKIAIAVTLLVAAFSIAAPAQCNAPILTFYSPVLISGTDGQIGAIYKFPNVLPDVDAHIEITDIVGDAGLKEIDDTTGAGYYDAFQPYVISGANDTSYIDWKITFKIAGTSTDTVLACLAVTGIDVDGNNADIKEFAEAATPGSFAIDLASNLQISFDGVRSKAIGQITTIPLIDTDHREAMFQMNFINISTLDYRNGAISARNSTDIRQTCIYFKPFFPNFILLPVKLISFNAVSQHDKVTISWSATDEQDIKNYTVQKSTDDINWKDLVTVSKGSSYGINNYFVTDAEKSENTTFYRLRQTGVNGFGTYSNVIKVSPANTSAETITAATLITAAITLQITATTTDKYNIRLFSANGNKVQQYDQNIYSGVNNPVLYLSQHLPPGIYFLTINNSKGKQLYSSKLFNN